MEFRTGQKVQAVDELGRWENATIEKASPTGGYYVSFDGWSADFDRCVPQNLVRIPIDPAKDEYAHLGKKRTRPLNKNHLSMLRTLCGGDVVLGRINGNLEEVTVIEVDRFNRSVVIERDDGETLPLPSCLLMELEDDVDKETKKRPLKKKKTTSKSVQEYQSSQDLSECPMEENSEPHEKNPFFQCPQTFLQVGDVARASDVGVSMGVQDIWEEGGSYTCAGFVVDGEGAMTDFHISGPTKKVKKLKQSTGMSRSVKQTLKKASKDAFETSLKRSKHNFTYRKAVRAGQLRQLVIGEVEKALKSKARARSFSFGLASLDVDLELFSLDYFDKRRRKFSLQDNNLEMLDNIFGLGWDVMKQDSCFYFVTNFVVSLTSTNVLKALVFTGCCPHPYPQGNVRQFLREFLQQV